MHKRNKDFKLNTQKLNPLLVYSEPNLAKLVQIPGKININCAWTK